MGTQAHVPAPACRSIPPQAPGSGDDLLPAVRRAQTGDVDAFEEVYRASAGRIFALCLRISGDRSRAEDLTQEVFIRAWRKLSQFRGDSVFTSWLYRLAINVVYSDLRRNRTSRQWQQPVEEDVCGEVAAHTGDPVSILGLEQAISTLPDGARAVLILHDVEGFQHQEIAERLGIAVGTSKAQLHRARRILRKVV